MIAHPTFEQISDLVERDFNGGPKPVASAGVSTPAPAPEDARAVAEHVAGCAECHDTARRLAELLRAASALPRDVAPPPELWSGLRQLISRERDGLRPAGAPERRSRRVLASWLAAAALILAFIGVSYLMDGAGGRAKASKLGPTQPTASGERHIAVLAVQQNYAAALDELAASLASRRHALDPATVAIVERSLAVIDTAIAEARAALASDPGNQAMAAILSANYERKVEFLRRASSLLSSS